MDVRQDQPKPVFVQQSGDGDNKIIKPEDVKIGDLNDSGKILKEVKE